MSKMSARDELKAMADVLYLQAVDKHAEGMNLLQTSTRLEQLSRIATEAEAEEIITMLADDKSTDIGLSAKTTFLGKA
jgi:hypothetical protein